ncbi:MAG: NAD(P)-binding domain-containing protein [Candidatus Korarchaeota archaeon]|nr:NAD(P)-binding domain-containing protein [Candidatus Korarchaeota archaeon]
MSSQIKNVTILGAGTMGRGIAQIFAAHGFNVWLVDVRKDALENAKKRITESLKERFLYGLIKEDPNTIISRIHFTQDVKDAVINSDFVIEAVPEVLGVKKSVLKTIDKIAPSNLIIASNTSGLSISKLASFTRREDKFIGMHFLNPPLTMQLVEITKGDNTSDETVNIIMELTRKIGKEPVLIKKDFPGAIVNNIIGMIFLQAFWPVASNEHKVEEIDASYRFKGGFPAGPFEVMDLIGLDVINSSFVPSMKYLIGSKFDFIAEMIKKLVNTNKLGVKTGEGFYKYPEPGVFINQPLTRREGLKVSFVEFYALPINSAVNLLAKEISSKEEIDKAFRLGYLYPIGIFELADTIGIDVIVNKLNELKNKRSISLYEPHEILKEMVKDGRLGIKVGEGFYKYSVKKEQRNKIAIRREEENLWLIFNDLLVSNRDLINELENILLEDTKDVKMIIFDVDNTSIRSSLPQKIDKDAVNRYKELIETLRQIKIPKIAILKGRFFNESLLFSLLADIRIADIYSTFGFLGYPREEISEIRGNLVPFIGLTNSNELLMNERVIGSIEAFDIGLVNMVGFTDELEFLARSYARKISARS